MSPLTKTRSYVKVNRQWLVLVYVAFVVTLMLYVAVLEP